MPEESQEPSAGPEVLAEKREWQVWTMVALGTGLLGLVLAIYVLLRAQGPGTSAVLQLVAALLYGIFALIVLINYYVSQRQAVVFGLRQEVVKQKIEAELNRELSLLDPVTEVYNRRYVRAILKREISRVKRYGNRLSVMMIDITGFRRVNDSLGHAGGDVVLREVAHLLQTRLRNSDMIVRFGGDEFLLVLTDSDEGGVATLGGRIKESFQEWTRRSGMSEFGLRFAVGIAHYSPERRIDEMLGLAEQRMLDDRRSAELPAGEARTPRPTATRPGS